MSKHHCEAAKAFFCHWRLCPQLQATRSREGSNTRNTTNWCAITGTVCKIEWTLQIVHIYTPISRAGLILLPFSGLLFAHTVDQQISRPSKWRQLQVTTIKITECKENKSIHRLDLSGSTDRGGGGEGRGGGGAAQRPPPPAPLANYGSGARDFSTVCETLIGFVGLIFSKCDEMS